MSSSANISRKPCRVNDRQACDGNGGCIAHVIVGGLHMAGSSGLWVYAIRSPNPLAMVSTGNGDFCPSRERGTHGFRGFPQTGLWLCLTTAHILYRRPDHRWLLQSYVWQNYDLFPEFPELHRFLAFWQKKLDGPLHSVRVAHCKLIKPAELKAVDGEFRLH